MTVSTIALYASPTGGVCSTPHGININAHASYDFDLNSRSASPASTTTASSSKKPIMGGLSCLFASPPIKHVSSSSFPVGGDDIGSYRGEELKDLSSAFCYSSSKFAAASSSSSRNNQSPVSVLQGPVPCSSSSSPMRIQGSFRGSAGGLFSGFVRGALGSCVDYDSPSFESQNRGFVDDELTFDMDDSFVGDVSAEPYARELLLDAQLRHKIFTEEFVVKAFYEAEKAHRGQMRASGDPYLRHCVETAILLALIGANSTVVAAGLLHDTFDDAFLSYDYIFRTLGAGVADLVEGVSKLSRLSKLARENNTACKTVEADRLHTMFLAMADARAVLIKLADRLHNMMTLDALSSVKQQRFAKETLEIFAPLANRLGISSWKEQLENLCFKYLHPEEHKEISSRFMVSYDEEMITSAVEKLERALKDRSIVYHVLSGRHKSLYSIYRKMLKKKLTMDEIHDIHGLRIIVESKEDCYDALNVVHQIWSEVPGKLKDYISHPKFNGYQSLHTVVVGDCRALLEVQIRTKEMHLQAEFGFAAHWRYKEDDHKQSLFVLQMVEWARWVLTWHCETANKEQDPKDNNDQTKLPCTFPSHSIDCPFACNAPCGDDRPVFVIVIENDKMSVQEFQANATVMDILERAGRVTSRWSPYGFPIKEELRPRLNREPVSDPTCKLKMGDVVELTPAIPDKLLVEYREEMKRMYDRNLAVADLSPITGSTLASRS